MLSLRFPILAMAALLFVISPVTLYGQATQSAGAKIGTIIKDAINVAFPNVTVLIDAIFGKNNKTDKKTATPAIDKQVSAAKQASNDKLKELSNISTELSVVNQYLDVTVPTAQQINRMMATLDNATGTTIPNGIRPQWEDVDKNIQKLHDVKPSDLNKIDPGLRLRLIEIRGIYDANNGDILSSINKNDVSGLKSQLRAISALLNSVVPIAGIEIASLQDGLDSVVKSIGATPQGGSPSTRLSSFSASMEEDIRTARQTLTKPPR